MCADPARTVGLRVLNQQTRYVLDLVRAGGTVVVTDHNQPIARIVPIAHSPLERLIAEGEYVGSLDAPLVPGPDPDTVSKRPTNQVLDETREDRV